MNRKHPIRALALLAGVALLVLAGAGCTAQPPANDVPDATESAQITLTIEALSAYDGKDGNPAYIAVDGIIYDVSGSARWRNGEHNGFTAGQDLTEMIKSESPHGVSVLSGMPVVGTIAD